MSNEKMGYIFERLEQVKELASELLEDTVSDEDTQTIGQDITTLVNDVMLEMRG